MQGKENKKTSFFSIPWVQTITASLICILLGLLIGFIALLIINPENAWDGIVTVLKNFWNYKQATKQETWVRSLVQEDSTCCRATKPVHHDS